MSLLENLQWRYATKKYDASKPVAEEDVQKILEAIRLAPTSSGLQPFRVLVITNPELKKQIVPIAFGQEIVADSSHLLVFAAWDRYTAERIDEVYDRITVEREQPEGRYNDYTNRLKANYLQQEAQQNFEHAARQAYIGLGFANAMAAELHVDSTPMEGFDNAALDALLDLPAQGLKSVLLLPLGHRDNENDWLVNLKKVRVPQENFITEIR